MHRPRQTLIAGFVALVLVGSACGGGDDDTADDGAVEDATAPTDPPVTEPPATEPPATEPPATEPPATEPPATEAPAPEGEIPENNSGWTLQPYAEEDITAGPVVAYWYRGANDGNYVVVYTGAGIAGARAAQALCPGNSILTTDFMHVSNAPTVPGACGGFGTDPGSLQSCTGGVWVYETKIPGDLEGTLFASLEWRSDDSGVRGLTSQAATMPEMAEVEPGLSSYRVPPWFTDDGSSTIECFAPVTE